MTDAAEPRPRPQYGEYATPEEQRARIRQPDVTQALEAGVAAPSAAPQVQPAAVPAAVATTSDGGEVAATPGKRRVIDRAITFGLLAYGLINVITSFSALIDYSAYAEQLLSVMGVDAELSDPGAGRAWGVAAALVLVVGWLATALVSWWNVSSRRISWWIPLVGGIVFTVAAGALMLVPLMSDPAVWNAMLDSVR